MDTTNPYLPPEASLAIQHDASVIELASRGQRLGAVLLDAIISLVFSGPLMYFTGVFDYSRAGLKPPFALTLGLTAMGFVFFLLVHGYFLKRDGQTVGKKIVGIRITDLDNGIPQFSKIILLRYLPISCVSLIPAVGQILAMIDPLFIFRSDHRCVHDLIAKTKVVKVNKG
ncbi:MAG TPA: RDD family protein [Burkholderiaceae bacterium]|jgi:uncharacterized RDD family membrane protein YckC